MSIQEENYTDYLDEHGVLPSLLDITENLLKIDPLPVDPLTEILRALGSPQIPQNQMKALERKVSRAQDELRYLRRVLIELDGRDQLYNSSSEDNDYVGHIRVISVDELQTQPPTPQYIVKPSKGQQEQLPQAIEKIPPCHNHTKLEIMQEST